MKLIELKRENFREIVDRPAIVLVECWAPECGACRQFDPIYQKVAQQFPEHTFARMNVVTDEKLGEFFEISGTPTLMLYRDGLLLLKKPGMFTEANLVDMVRQAESLDMEMVRADLESSKSQNRNERKDNE